MTDPALRYRRLEVERRRPGAPHPDACGKLVFRGASFAIPPRGLRAQPAFNAAGEASVRIIGVDERGDIAGLLKRVAGAMTGRKLRLSLDGGAALLADLMALARRLLLAHYDLTDEEIADLLSFPTDSHPAWIAALIRWALGLPTEASPTRRRRWPWRRARRNG